MHTEVVIYEHVVGLKELLGLLVVSGPTGLVLQ